MTPTKKHTLEFLFILAISLIFLSFIASYFDWTLIGQLKWGSFLRGVAGATGLVWTLRRLEKKEE